MGKGFIKTSRDSKVHLTPILLNITVMDVLENSADLVIEHGDDKFKVTLQKYDTFSLTINPIIVPP